MTLFMNLCSQQIDAKYSGVRPQTTRHRLKQFAGDESGAIVGFALFLFLMMLMVGGIGIDLMHSEMRRTKLQGTLDRAILAAADLGQELSPEAVVDDYFDKAGMSEHLSTVVVDEGLNYRVVSAEASATIDTMFMKMVGVDTLTVPATGTAEERIDGVEISMVLDVSGSMRSNSRLSNLKIAARDFIDTMEANSEDGKLSISIVPYATQVSAPDELFAELNVTNEHSYSNCINFESADFDDSGISPTQEYNRTMHFDPWDDYDGRDNDPVHLITSPVCEASNSREMMIVQKNSTELKSFISNLSADGNTSIDVGMKWGTALLDPAMQPAISNLADDGYVDASFSVRPYAYDAGETLKVIVLMTDGQNTSQYYLEDDYRTGDSNIWWNEQEEVYSVYVGLDTEDEDNDGVTEEPLFYWPLDNAWHDHAYGEGTYEETQLEYVCRSYKRNGSCKRYRRVKTTVLVDEPGEAAIITYADLWAYTSMEWIVEDLYEPWMSDSDAWDDWYYAIRKYVGGTTKNARTKQICDAAKAQGIVVFTIGFEAPSSGVTVLKDCASSISHYFDVDGLEITDAFSAIASSIAQLKLTQ